MSLSPTEVWKRLLDRARQELPDQTFQAWLEPTEALSIEGSTIFVGAPDQFTPSAQRRLPSQRRAKKALPDGFFCRAASYTSQATTNTEWVQLTPAK